MLLISGCGANSRSRAPLRPAAAEITTTTNYCGTVLSFCVCVRVRICVSVGLWGLAAPAASRTNSALVACYFSICTRAWARSARRRRLQVLSKYNSRQSLCRGACVSNFSELLLCVYQREWVSVCMCLRSLRGCFVSSCGSKSERAQRCALHHLPIWCGVAALYSLSPPSRQLLATVLAAD